ncbi:MAG: hypothetical protein GY938_16560 [Ketobacter sp.]|nr:hypothetical protein [Ketobacter sp.]
MTIEDKAESICNVLKEKLDLTYCQGYYFEPQKVLKINMFTGSLAKSCLISGHLLGQTAHNFEQLIIAVCIDDWKEYLRGLVLWGGIDDTSEGFYSALDRQSGLFTDD